ncbi:MAG: Methyltransferase type 11 [Crocinitomicaceae bacterium]|jgi:2-polyprenyl-3-methyl-5-hydroxy-6-metoxy-1,4-benzoquinol methylase|nr:Methyltransferase type 11 [Crocinitomicaceae bacterium]
MTNSKEAFLQVFKKTKLSRKDGFILELAKGKRVLDVGCVGQDLSYSEQDWLHNKLQKTALSVDGVDINREGIAALNDKGYNILHIDELKEKQLRYDLVVIGDVIEHVDNLCEFLNFYKEFLTENGRIVITTPNPFSFRQNLSVFLYKIPSVNQEHTCWLDPITFVEIANRCELKIERFAWLGEYTKAQNFQQKVIYGISRLFYGWRKYYSPNFGFLVSR